MTEQANVGQSQSKPLDFTNVELPDISGARLSSHLEKALKDGRLTFVIVDEGGLHMRPSGQIIDATNRSGCKVDLITSEDNSAEGNSIFLLLMLGAEVRQELTVIVTRKDAGLKGAELRGTPEVFWKEALQFDFWSVKE